jgi:peptidoglycan hydrolase-like protein with peptidoglycan-binding domain
LAISILASPLRSLFHFFQEERPSMSAQRRIQLISPLILALLVSAGCGPAQLPSPTITAAPTASPTPTSTPTVTPSPTLTPTPSITPTATPAVPDWPVLESGDWDIPEVFVLQRLLRHHGYTIPADGKFGKVTAAQVLAFQDAHSLPTTGMVDALTWSALVEDVLLEEGDSDQAVRALQHLLKYKFGYESEVDGTFGPATTEAVRRFQASVNLPVDGIVGDQTWQALIATQP